MSAAPRSGRITPRGDVVKPPPSVRHQLILWLRIGASSFGGGQGTRLNVYRSFVERGGWMSPLEYAEAWAVCQIGPGMSLVALAALMGYRFSRAAGAAAALLGLLVPSGLITVAITVIYLRLNQFALTQAALHGIVAAVLGLAIANVIFNARPLLAASREKGLAMLVLAIVLIATDAVVFAALNPPVLSVLLPSAAVFAICSIVRARIP
jgi:chromate transporter